MAAILNFGSRTTSGNVPGDIVRSGMFDNVRLAVGIAASSLAVQKWFPRPVFAGRHLEFWWSTIVYQRRSTSVSVCSQCQVNVGRDQKTVGIISVCCGKPTLHRPAENLRFIFPWKVPLVFQVATGNGKRYLLAKSVETSGNWPSRIRFWQHFKIPTGRKNIRNKNIPKNRCSRPVNIINYPLVFCLQPEAHKCLRLTNDKNTTLNNGPTHHAVAGINIQIPRANTHSAFPRDMSQSTNAGRSLPAGRGLHPLIQLLLSAWAGGHALPG